jgi:hypothetical protein
LATAGVLAGVMLILAPQALAGTEIITISGVVQKYAGNPNLGATGNLDFFGVPASSLLGDAFSESFTYTSGKGTNLSSGGVYWFDGSGTDTPTSVVVTIGAYSVAFAGDEHGFIEFEPGADDTAYIGAVHDTGAITQTADVFITNSPTQFLNEPGISQPNGTYALSSVGTPYFYFNPTFDTSSKSDLYDAVATQISFATGVPEPGAWTLILTGLAGAGAALRARRKRDVAPPEGDALSRLQPWAALSSDSSFVRPRSDRLTVPVAEKPAFLPSSPT